MTPEQHFLERLRASNTANAEQLQSDSASCDPLPPKPDPKDGTVKGNICRALCYQGALLGWIECDPPENAPQPRTVENDPCCKAVWDEYLKCFDECPL